MGGGLMQLVSYGAQDIYISGNPQITFWKILYKRHTNFAMESIEVTFNGQADFNKRVTAVINRNADLMYKTYVQVVLPQVFLGQATGSGQPLSAFRWVNYIGHRLIKQVEVEIGGQRIDRQYGDWMQIWTQLSTEAGSTAALDSLIGNTHDLVLLKKYTGAPLDATCSASETTLSCVARAGCPAKTLYVPLQFWFCRNPGVAIPLIALQYHEVRINVDFETWENCTYAEGGPSAYTVPTRPDALSLAAASLYIDYVYLDTEERRRFAQQSHEYLIEQVQFTGAESITSSSNKIQLNFNHPVKELQWVVQRDSFVDCSYQAWIASVGGQQPFNYSDDFSTEGIIMSLLSQGTAASVPSPIVPVGGTGRGMFVAGPDAYPGQVTYGAGDAANSNSVGDGQEADFDNGVNYLLAKVILDSGVRCEGKNPVEVCKLQLNGQDRFTEREGSYFDRVQPYQHHCRTPSTGINCYSFALRPEEHQPSGTCNFSRIDKATLQLTVSLNTVTGFRTAQVRVYALNYNVLRVMSGMGGLAYSN
uniref:Major capsid protein N-terminal domain-containing protein n=1 Tax=viral metagenome TaxID=1070528 RepID=A0A6C0B2I5_9ZZZZ